jgi:hypothetical protein
VCRPARHFNVILHNATCCGPRQPSQALLHTSTENVGTFEHAINLALRSHYIWLFIEIINMYHIYRLKYPKYEATKKQTKIKLFKQNKTQRGGMA